MDRRGSNVQERRQAQEVEIKKLEEDKLDNMKRASSKLARVEEKHKAEIDKLTRELARCTALDGTGATHTIFIPEVVIPTRQGSRES